MAGIFISYRQVDTLQEAGHLRSLLATRFPEPVFRDHEAIPPGATWHEVSDAALADADVVLVLIGPHWYEELAVRAERDDVDVVVHEVRRALELDRRVVPVLVQRRLPRAEAERLQAAGHVRATAVAGGQHVDVTPVPPTRSLLPPAIAGLADRDAVELRLSTISADVDALADQVEPDVKDLRTRLRRAWRRVGGGAWTLAGALGAAAVGLVAWLLLVDDDVMGPGGTDVAVAGWQVVTDDVTTVLDPDAKGRELGDDVADRLAAQLVDAPAASALDEVWGPDRVGIVRGDDAAARRGWARETAERVGADLVVYGTAAPRADGRFDVDVAFVLVADQARPTDPTGVERTFSGVVDLRNLRPGDLASAVPDVDVVVALVAALRDLDRDELDDARVHVDRMQELAVSDEAVALADLVRGLHASRAAEMGDAEANLSVAVAAFEDAVAADPDFEPARLALLGARYLSALSALQAGDADARAELVDVGDDYAALAVDAPGRSLPTRAQAQAMVGQVEVALAVTPDAPAEGLRRAEDAYRATIALAEAGGVELELIGSGAWAGLALVHTERGDLAAAADAYQQARVRSSPYWRVRYSLSLGVVLHADDQPCRATEAFDDVATEIATRPELTPPDLDLFQPTIAAAAAACDDA